MSDDPNKTVKDSSPAPISSTTPGAGEDLLRAGIMRQPDQPGMLGKIGRFDVIKLIGQGGMGQVLLAREPVTNVKVAIKVLKPEFARDATSVHRFLTEARHAYAMSHPNILKVMEVSDSDDRPFYVVPYVEGGSLARRIGPQKPLPTQTALDIARQIAGALSYAHGRGIIHRDLKPANVLVDGEGRAYLTDFGLLRTVFNDSFVDVQQSSLEGTAPYMSPAVVEGKAEDTRCDIYSFGAMLYEMLTGQPPYLGPSVEIILQNIAAGPPEPLLKINPKASKELAAIAQWAMARELRDRYATMADVLADLERVAKGQAPVGPRGTVGLNSQTRRKLAIAGAAVVIVVAFTTLPIWKRVAGLAPGSGGETTATGLGSNFVVNGSFELPVTSENTTALPTGSTQMPGWTVGPPGSIDIIRWSWAPSEGLNSLDLAGNQPGLISQDVLLTKGTSYLLEFDMAFNVHLKVPASLQVSIGGYSKSFTRDLMEGAPFWRRQRFNFVATNTGLAKLTFQDTTVNGNGGVDGAALDNVRLVADATALKAVITPLSLIQQASAERTEATHSPPSGITVAPPCKQIAAVNGKTLWLKAGVGVVAADPSGRTARWKDQSGKGHDAVSHGSRMPLLIWRGPGGDPSVQFDGIDDFMTIAGSGSLLSDAHNFTVVIKCQMDFGGDNVQEIISNWSSADTGVYFGRWNDKWRFTDLWGPAVEGSRVSMGRPVVMTFRCRNGKPEIFEDGVAQLEPGASPPTDPSARMLNLDAPWVLGRQGMIHPEVYGNGFESFRGHLMEIVVFDRSLTDSERAQVEACLGEKSPGERSAQTDGRVNDWDLILKQADAAYAEHRFEEALKFYDAVAAHQGIDPVILKTIRASAEKCRGIARFIADRQKLPVDKQDQVTQSKLRELNTNYQGNGILTIGGGNITEAVFDDMHITDISPLAGLPLKRLSLSRCRLEDTRILGGMTNLIYLALNDNQLIRDISPLGKARNLQTLHLGGNQISDISALTNLHQLEYLGIAGNPVELPVMAHCWPRLWYLDLWRCELESCLPLAGMTSLQELHIGASPRITDISPLGSLSNLQRLFAGGDQIADISVLTNMHKLKILVLPGNPITNLAVLTGYCSLMTELELWNCGLKSCLPLSGMTNLTRLDIRMNQITDIAPLATLTNLKELGVGGNPITNAAALTNLAHLTGLSMDGTPSPGWIPTPASFPRLTVLYLSDGGLSSVEPLTAFTNLTRLALSGNRISDLPPLAGLRKLHELNLANNPITDISVLKNMRELRELHLDGTSVADLSPLKGLPLVRFWGRGTRIKDVSPLASAPLEEFCFSPESDPKGLQLLRTIKTLRHINDQPAADFWNRFDRAK